VRGCAVAVMKRPNTTLARTLRKDSTWAERALWKRLRNRGVGGAKFRRQFGVGPYILDFYCAEAMLAVELDGDVHGEPQQRRHDRRRDEFFNELGIEVLRFWNEEVRTNLDGVLETILRTLETRAVAPHLNPLPAGERRPEVK
jgi:very-short-patch-repair endonuclease